jgi:hypothetical protein
VDFLFIFFFVIGDCPLGVSSFDKNTFRSDQLARRLLPQIAMCHASQVLWRMQVGSFGLTLARHTPQAWQGGLEHLFRDGVTPIQLMSCMLVVRHEHAAKRGQE